MSNSGAHRSRAEELFDEYLARREAGESVDFDALCSRFSSQAEELRSLHDALELLRKLRPNLLPQAPLAERLLSKPHDGNGSTSSPGGNLPRDSPHVARSRPTVPEERVPGTRYRVISQIGRGGMGKILCIWDSELRRRLAMKVVHRDAPIAPDGGSAAESRTLRRFLDEAQVTGQLDHPGIVPVHELGLASDGRAYFTMRLVHGEDLGRIFEHVRSGRDGWNQVRALSVILKVCEAMSYAHSKGVVHRDLKPANVMVGKFGEVYVLDWGVARVPGRADLHDLRIQPPGADGGAARDGADRGRAAGGSPLLTMDGDVVGTPSFMPPEQAKGQIELIGAHSDVYAVGAMLYQLLGGELPYTDGDPSPTQQAILARLLAGAPRPLESLAPRTPPELLAIVDKAMARSIEQRYPTMQALADDLRAFGEHRVVKAYEAGAWAEFRKWVRRNPAKSAAAGIGLLALIVNSALTMRILATQGDLVAKRIESDGNAAQARMQAAIATQRAEDVLRLSAQKDLEELVARADELWPAEPKLIPQLEQWLRDARSLLDGRAPDPRRGIKARQGLEGHRAKLAELRARAMPQGEAERRADRDSHPSLGELERKRAELTWYSRMLGFLSWPSEAEVEAQLREERLPEGANALNGMAWSLVNPTQPAHDEELRALLLARRALAETSDSDRPYIHDSLAWANLRLGRFDEARIESARASSAATSELLLEFGLRATALKEGLAAWTDETELAKRRSERDALLASVADLERAVNERRTWTFQDAEDAWWHAQLVKLVEGLEALQDPEHGLMGDTTATSFFWGVQKRLDLAIQLRERCFENPESVRRWAEARQAVLNSPLYGGLDLKPQSGLLPLGPDPTSGLWEFWHVVSGTEPRRGPTGALLPDGDMGIVLVLLPGGEYHRGAQSKDPRSPNHDVRAHTDEGPVRTLVSSPFFLSKYEMTQGQWLRFTGRNPSNYGPQVNFGGHQHSLRHPVEQVTWEDAHRVLRRLGLSLSSEAQWEYACRAGTSTPWWTGEERESLRGKLNLADQAAARIGAVWPDIKDWPEIDDGWAMHAAVGSFAPNPFGLHDMHGNLWEWCLDSYDPAFYRVCPNVDPVSAPDRTPRRAMRGGSFLDAAAQVRAALRRSAPVEHRARTIGLRPSRPLEHS